MTDPAPRPMLCHTAASLADVPADWLMEPKLDGWRWTVRVDADRVRSFAGRNGSDHTGETTFIADTLKLLPVGTVLDGELIGGFSSGGVSTGLAGGPGAPAMQMVVFDLLQLGSHDLRKQPLSARRSMLESVFAKLIPEQRHVVLNIQVPIDHELFARWLDDGAEGVVCKRADSGYHPGKRSRDWLKVKPMQTADAEIVALHPGKVGGWNEHMVGRFEIRMLDTGVLTAVAPNNPGDCQDAKDHPENWLGHLIEIRYQLLFEGGVPRHPVFSRLRPDLEGANTDRDSMGSGPVRGRGLRHDQPEAVDAGTGADVRGAVAGDDRRGHGSAVPRSGGRGQRASTPSASGPQDGVRVENGSSRGRRSGDNAADSVAEQPPGGEARGSAGGDLASASRSGARPADDLQERTPVGGQSPAERSGQNPLSALPKAPPRKQRMKVMRNYKAMALPKLAKCVAELEAQQGDAYDRVIAKDGDPAADLEVAKGVLAGKAA